MAHWEHIPFGNVVYVTGASPTHKPECAFLLAAIPKCSPAFRNQWLEAGICKIIHAAAYDFFPWEAQELDGAETNLPADSIVVCDQDGRRRAVYDRPERQFELFGPVFG
jgi:hypothetical protein